MGGNLNALTTIFTEFYYWVTIVFMFLIHVGFCTYEVGVSRRRNHLKTLMKNAMVIPLVTITFFFFGWWIYFALPNGPVHRIEGKGLDSRRRAPAPTNTRRGRRRWAPTLQDHITGVFWAAFLLFSMDGGLDRVGLADRTRQVGRVLDHRRDDRVGDLDHRCGLGLAFRRLDGEAVGAIMTPMLLASSMPSPAARRSAFSSCSVRGSAGSARTARRATYVPHNPWLVTIGLFLIYTGFWGFYAACNMPIISPATIAGQITGETWTATTIYLDARPRSAPSRSTS